MVTLPLSLSTESKTESLCTERPYCDSLNGLTSEHVSAVREREIEREREREK